MSSFLTFQKALKRVGVDLTWELFEQHFTPDWHRMYEAVGVTADRFREADEAWKHSYPCVNYGLVEEARPTLRELKERGYLLGVVTSGSRWRLDPEIRDFGLEGIFDVVICNEDVLRRKPDPEGILKAVASLGCKTACCAYVGDVPEDIAAGRSARTVTVGLKSLYPTSRKLAECGPDLNLERLGDLLKHF